MHPTNVTTVSRESRTTTPTPAMPRGMSRRLIHARLMQAKHGLLTIREGDERFRYGDPSAPPELTAEIRVHDAGLWNDIVRRGVLGAGEGFAAGDWTTDNLTAVVRFFVRNRDVMSALDGGLARISRWVFGAILSTRRNHRARNRRDVSFHYHLGNEFFRTFLDETLTYSSGVFETPESTLADASRAKYERLCQAMDLRPSHRVLEIGCGWGGFAEYAAANYGCEVVATTISKEQHAYASERIRAAGLDDRVRIVMQDYRDLTGTFDRIASIEMIEAVGHDQLDTYVQTLSDRLAPDGVAAIQAITIADQQYDRARRSMDFIKKHIFPGTFIPSLAAIGGAVGRRGDLRMIGLDDYGLHYAETLDRWCRRFLDNVDEIRAMGFPEAFIRGWEYYLRYCEGGFRERYLSVVHLTLAKPDHAPTLAPSRHA